MSDHYFVSYSRADGSRFSMLLADHLLAGTPSFRLWVDVRELRPGHEDWDEQIARSIETCRGLLFLMTPDSVGDESGCRLEWRWALKHKKPVIPLRMHPDADLPYLLQTRQYVDFTAGFEVGVSRLRLFLEEAEGPRGALRELRFQLADAERELPRAPDAAARDRILQDLSWLRDRIAQQTIVTANPPAAAAATSSRIDAGLERERKPERLHARPISHGKFVNPPPMTAPSYFQGRQDETNRLANSLAADDIRMVTVVGRGGVGKTAMVCRLLKFMETGRVPEDVGITADQLRPDGIVYLRTAGEHPVSFANLFTDLCRLLPSETADPLLARYRDPHETPTRLMSALLEAFPSGRSVVLLDNVEDLTDTGSGEITDRPLDEALRALLSAPAHGVKIIITTRVTPVPLMLHEPGVQRQIDLDEGLPSPYAEQLLRARDPDGKLGLKFASDAELSAARERTRGYPRALEALAAILSADRNTSLPELLDQTKKLPENVVKALVGAAYLRLDPLSQQVMQALAIFPVPVPAVAVDYLLQPYVPAINAAPALAQLVNMLYVRRDAGHYDLHQVDRDYALDLIPAGTNADRGSDPPPFNRATLRHRAADYFTQVQTRREEWKSLDDLAPQLAEFELRYQVADYDTAAQVLLSFDGEYLQPWGHFLLNVELLERLSNRLTDPWVINLSIQSLGNCHYRLGNLSLATNLYEKALAGAQENGYRLLESNIRGGLGNCYSDRGQIDQAFVLYEQALAISREHGDQDTESILLGNLANHYTIIAQWERAKDLYQQALKISRDIDNKLSETLQMINFGFWYSELGNTTRAIELSEQALEISRKQGDRPAESESLTNVGYCYARLGQRIRAIDNLRRSVDIADTIGMSEIQIKSRHNLASIQLWSGNFTAARETAEAARYYTHPKAAASIALVKGLAQLREGSIDAAVSTLRVSVVGAEELQAHNTDNYDALYTRAVALTGLTLAGVVDGTLQAREAFSDARRVTTAEGVIYRVRCHLDALAPVDHNGLLPPIRSAALGLDAEDR